MSDLRTDAIAFLRARFVRAIIIDQVGTLHRGLPGALVEKSLTALVAHDFDGGVKQLMFAVPDLCTEDAKTLRINFDQLTQKMDGDLAVSSSDPHDPHGNDVSSRELTWSGKLVLFTDTLGATAAEIRAEFPGKHVEVVDHSNRRRHLSAALQTPFDDHDSVFISYGGTDEAAAARINTALEDRNVKTWFFKDDALPGQKLHRMMSEGVHNHDRVIFLCSKKSLSRPGVLNELERVLEREAREGGADILLPLRLDDHVLGDWAPARRDIADQVRSRVIGDFTGTDADPVKFKAEMEKVFRALSRAGRET